MGTIKQDILDNFLSKHPEQVDILKPFLSGFDITYAEKKEINKRKTTKSLTILWSRGLIEAL